MYGGKIENRGFILQLTKLLNNEFIIRKQSILRYALKAPAVLTNIAGNEQYQVFFYE